MLFLSVMCPKHQKTWPQIYSKNRANSGAKNVVKNTTRKDTIMASVIVKVNGVNKVVEAETVGQVKDQLNLSKYTLRTKAGDVLTDSSSLSDDMIIVATQNVQSA